MYEDVFNRVELKYIISKKQHDEFIKKIKNYIKKDKYYQSKICNIYFDNESCDMIINSIEKPMFKQKVRLRSYDVPKTNDDVFLEVKTKYKKVVTKRRIKVKLKEFNEYLESGKYNHNNQIMKEIDYLFNYYKLKPSYFLAYDRISFCGIESKDLRITIDENLRSRKNDLYLNLGDKGKKYFKDKTYIMEIKHLNALPIWLVRSLSELKIYPVSFSKLGSVYKKEMEDNLC